MCDVCVLAAEASVWHDGRLRSAGFLGPRAGAPVHSMSHGADATAGRTRARGRTRIPGRVWLLVIAFALANYLLPGVIDGLTDARFDHLLVTALPTETGQAGAAETAGGV